MELYTIPDEVEMNNFYKQAQDHKVPNTIPYAVVLNSALTQQECWDIEAMFANVESYKFPACHANNTREYPHTLTRSSGTPMDILIRLSLAVNTSYFDYDLHAETTAWMQTYAWDNYYQKHRDGYPGQSRKMTAVLFLTDPEKYRGGKLRLELDPRSHQTIAPDQGTVVIFPSWLYHEVTPVRSGSRRTINLAFWGPPFR